MDYKTITYTLQTKYNITPRTVQGKYTDEVHLEVSSTEFKTACISLHSLLQQPIAMLLAVDEGHTFTLRCVFMSPKYKKWFFINTSLGHDIASFPSLAKEVYSCHLFEREIKEMFGILPEGNPDLRRLNLHEEVWPEGYFPLRKNFVPPLLSNEQTNKSRKNYPFIQGEGEGIFEIPVGPVHAGIIGPGHFRFSVAGEPIINLEIRLGFTHRGAEKHFEGKSAQDAARLAECIAGDTAFGHSLAFCHAVEKIYGLTIPLRTQYSRSIFLELERMYNHAADIGGMATDVGFSFPAALASLIKETILRLNQTLTGSRYLKGINIIGGITKDINNDHIKIIQNTLPQLMDDFSQLCSMLFDSVSFMDRVDSTGVLKKKTAIDLGVKGLAGRAVGIRQDLRHDFTGLYESVKFKISTEETGDVLARLKVRIAEFKESSRLISEFIKNMASAPTPQTNDQLLKAGSALGYVEGWRGPILYWVETDSQGKIDRCKIVDPSVQNWQGLAYCVLGDIVPDFPLCNKSFDLSYAGNDL